MAAQTLRAATPRADVDADRDDAALIQAVLAHRFARSALELVAAQHAWLALGERADRDGEDVGFAPAAMLFNGWLPGSVMVSAQSSMTPRAATSGRSLSDRIALAPYTRTAIQIGVAVTGAIVAGDALNGRRFYWAVLAAFVTFMATSNTGEQLRKAFYRLAGTAVGIVLGIVLVHVTEGHSVWSLVVVMVAIFLALYLIRISYVFMVLGITIMVSQLYVQLDEYSNGLLLLRLEETAIGFGVVVLTVLLVLPLRTSRVLQTAAVNSLTALAQAVEAAAEVLVAGADRSRDARLRDGVRAVDACHHEMLAVTGPMRRMTFGATTDRVATAVAVSSATRYYVRSLAADLDGWGGLRPDDRAAGRHAAGELGASLSVLTSRLGSASDGTYIRSASLFDGLVDDSLRPDGGLLAVRDLTLIDAALARAAERIGLAVADHDTVVATTAAGSSRTSPLTSGAGGRRQPPRHEASLR